MEQNLSAAPAEINIIATDDASDVFQEASSNSRARTAPPWSGKDSFKPWSKFAKIALTGEFEQRDSDRIGGKSGTAHSQLRLCEN